MNSRLTPSPCPHNATIWRSVISETLALFKRVNLVTPFLIILHIRTEDHQQSLDSKFVLFHLFFWCGDLMLELKNKISYSLTVYYIDFIFKCALSARLWPVCLTAFSIQWNSFQAVRKILCHVIYWLNTKCKIRIYPNAYGLRLIFIFWDSQIYTKLVWGGLYHSEVLH